MNEFVDGFVDMNINGNIKDLCEKYYAPGVLMLNNGAVFATSQREAYEKQKGFVLSIATKDITLLSKEVTGSVSELIFHYVMETHNGQKMDFVGKHTQEWDNGVILKEEYESVQ